MDDNSNPNNPNTDPSINSTDPSLSQNQTITQAPVADLATPPVATPEPAPMAFSDPSGSPQIPVDNDAPPQPEAQPTESFSFSPSPAQNSGVPDYSSNPSQLQTEANQSPIADQNKLPDSALPNEAPLTQNAWDTPQSEPVTSGVSPAQNQVYPEPEAPTQTPMSEQLNNASFTTPPSEMNQPPVTEPSDLPKSTIPTDSQGIPAFASQEPGVSSYSPFQSNPAPATPQAQAAEAAPIETPEPAPTDLSQLTENVNGQAAAPQENAVYTPPVSNTDTLVVSADTATTSNTVQADHPKKSLPLIAIIGALVILLLVAAASAYFILGIGQAQVAEPAVVPPPAPTVAPTEELAPESSPEEETESGVNDGSSDFGALSGEEQSSGVFVTEPQASSAAEIIKARQAAQQSSGESSPAPTPIQ